MDNTRARKTSGESTASDTSETASCRPYYLPETPAAFPPSQVVRSATPSTWYVPRSSSASRVGGDSQSPADLMDSHKSNKPCCSYSPSPKFPLSITVPTESSSVRNSTLLNKSREEKRGLSPSWSTPNPKQAKLTNVDKTALKLSIDVENMTPAEHNTQDRTLVSASQDGGPQETSAIPVSSGHTQSSCTVAEAPQTPMSPIPTEGEVLRLIASKYLLNAPPSFKADHDDFLECLESMRGFIAGVDRGCLPIKDPAGDPLKILFEPVEEEEEEEEEHDDVTETVRQLKSDIKKLKKWKIKGELSDEGPDTKSESKIKAELSDEGPDTKSERNIEAELSDEGLDTKSKSKIKAKVSGEGSDTKSERKIKAELSDEGPDTKSERKIKGELSDEGPDTESERKIKAELSDEGLDTKSKSKIKAELSDEGPDTKSERKIKAKLSDEGPDTKSESRVKIDLLQKTLGTKSEKCEINRLGVVWKPQGIQAAACITFPPNAVTQPVLFICTLLEDPMHYPPLKKDEALVSDVIELSYDDPHGSNFTGDFGEMVSVALPHSATNLRGYEIVIRELVDSHNNDWRDLETTNTWQASGEVPFAEAKVMCCSSFAVVCRLKSYTYTPHALEDRDFTCTVEEYPDVIVTVPASVVRENKELQLTLKVQEIPRQWYEDSGVIVGPVLHITCSPEIQLFDPATITLPFSLQNNNECAKLSSGNVRVLVNSHEEDENETNPRADWEEITTQLPRPAALRNGVVTFQVTHFSWYTILWERSAERNRKRKRGAFQMTGRKSGALQMTRRKSPNFRITGRIPQAGCFFACLCTTNTEYLPLGEYCLHCFCCPLHVESRVKEIIRSTEGAILYGGGESSEPLCPDDVIHISLLKGLEADGHTTDDETQLRFRGDRHYSRYLMVEWTDKRRYTPKVDFHRCLDDQSQRSLYTCSIVISVGRMESQPVAVRDHTLTRKEAFNLSQELGSHWKSLGRQLEIDEHLLTKFHTENEELEEKAYQMLLYWKRKHASTATYDVLFKALCEVSRRDLAEKYCAANTNSL